MAVNALRGFAREAPAPVFAAAGEAMRDRLDLLFTDSRLERVATPRHAAILFIAGPMRLEDREDLRRLHDQMPHPRATLLWDAEVGEALGDAERLVTGAHAVDPSRVVEAAIDRLTLLWRELVEGERDSEADLLKDEPANPWEGIGPHGQGGKGMMGGTPYGRPMAMTADDLRDGLALDAYTARFGPFLPMFPPGLLLEMTLQGDMIQSAAVLRPPLAQAVDDVESASLLRLARLLDLLGLSALALRARLTAAGDPSSKARGSFERAIRWSGAPLAIPPGLGAMGGTDVRARFLDLVAASDGRAAARPPVAADTDHLSSLLPGLEWTEALLLLNSFDNVTLAALAALSDEKEEEEGGRDEHEGGHMHPKHDHHEHGGHQGQGDRAGHDGQKSRGEHDGHHHHGHGGSA
ncbi:hypothetical protein [Aurantimonas sp. VKM B-3413]|uniref:hypothetical protein n=1 Tax=Aurantimonas sp. VKM B-3413 TaxID=2779401 RepID=UPI001E48C469|nr:hypothetical protein [Aurantimonas sp. VKM B-3413]MCB8840267.1 hypothetical protein [Aurantimonas sp. VKM B-3413]